MINSSGKSKGFDMASAVTEAPVAEEKLVRGLGLLDSTMLVAGSMIGSGIFIVSSIIARQVGAPGWLLVVWIVTGVLTLMAALSYGELAAMMPKAGGQYVYLREAFSPLWGFLYGWTLVSRDSNRNDRSGRGRIRPLHGRARAVGFGIELSDRADSFRRLRVLAFDCAVGRPGADRAADVHEHARLEAGQARAEHFHDSEDGRAHRADRARHHRRAEIGRGRGEF